jgi:Rps23 Pro-64 3,4-dihydroxylase Tpa1-like proline 4-hydroxylase
MPAVAEGLSSFFAEDGFARLLEAGPAFRSAEPFPHLVLDGLFEPARLRDVAASFHPGEDPRWHRFADASREVKLAIDREDHFPPAVRDLVQVLNGAAFLQLLSEVTGIPGLVADTYFSGGGMHQIMPGGKLAIHADFNIHPVTRLHRRLNLLVYLNEGWHDEWGGHLELWDRTMTRCEQRIAPTFNRLALFRTDSHSYHGHPEPLACPVGSARRSVALYYYTALSSEDSKSVGEHNTAFQERPGEAFTDPPWQQRWADASMLVREAGKLLVPPAWRRALHRRKGLLGSAER